MKPHFTKLIAVQAAILMMMSCSSLKVTSDFDKAKDFKTLKTFAFHEKTTAINALNATRLTAAVKHELETKGYTETATAPDFMVNIVVILKNRADISATTQYNTMGAYGYGGFYRPYGYWGGGTGMVTSQTDVNVDHYVDGSLIIDMIDAKTSKLFWEGTGNDQIYGNEKDPEKKINEAVAKILTPFPLAGMQPVQKK